MIALEIRFLAGRYHATPWGRHVNEGATEWPPSPWRLLRALVAAWRRNAHEVAEEEFRALIAALAAPPMFSLPPCGVGHARHWMPWFKKGPRDRTLVFDAFLALDRDAPVLATWPNARLAPDQTRLLERLVGGIPYLGRAESWCEVRLAEDAQGEPSARPLAEGESPRAGEDAARVLCWDGADAVERAVNDEHPLCVDTGDLRKRLMDPGCPPGGQWIRYAVVPGATRRAAAPSPQADLPVLALYTLHSRVLPLTTETVSIGDLARAALQAHYGRLSEGAASPVFSGRDGDGRPTRVPGHGHAHYLPFDADGDGRLDRLAVYAPQGFGPREREALSRIDALVGTGDRHPLRMLLLGLGAAEAGAGLVGPSRSWESATPFLLIRHPKRNGRDTPADQVRLELERRGLPVPAIMDSLDASNAANRRVRWIEFRRWRQRGAGPALGRGFGFRLTFDRPVQGPIALGYGSHFGLGLFLPCE